MTPQDRVRYGKLIAQAGPRDAAILAALHSAFGDRARRTEVLAVAYDAYVFGLAVGAYQPEYAKAILALGSTAPPSEDEAMARAVATDIAPLA